MFRWISGFLIVVSAGAMAAESTGGFRGPDDVQSVTVSEAANLPDDTSVKVQGFVVRSLGDEEYAFEDETGSMTVEIDDDEWQGIEADPSTRVELRGEIDKDADRIELDVERISLVQG